MKELTLKSLIDRLKKQWAPASTIIENDIIVVQDGNFWVVSKVRKNPNGFYTILSEQGDGFLETDAAHVFLIINRGCFGN